MTGTFNNIPIDDVMSLKLTETRSTFRVLGCPRPELERQFKRGCRTSVRISIHEFSGVVVSYRRAASDGIYEVTIKNRA
jgi:hypothetical protein